MELAVISGKGGTGKSIISAALATLNSNVVLADCDVDAANQYLIFNPLVEQTEVFIGGLSAVIDKALCTNCAICISYCRFDAISFVAGEVVISEISCDGCQLCKRICPELAITMVSHNNSRLYSGSFRNGKMIYGRLAAGEENSGKLVNLVRERARYQAKINNIDTIIIDGPPGIGCPVISSITGVNKVVVVTEPSLSGLHDLKRAVEITKSFGVKTWVIINKYDLNIEITSQIKAFCNSENIAIAGQLPFEAIIVDAMINCRSIWEWDPHSGVSLEIKSIWETITDESIVLAT